MGTKNRVDREIEAETLEIVTMIENKWWDKSWLHEKHWLSWDGNISHHIQKIFFIFLTAQRQYHEIVAPKVTWKIFTCIAIHQTFVPP